jgi:hypothetical protein
MEPGSDIKAARTVYLVHPRLSEGGLSWNKPDLVTVSIPTKSPLRNGALARKKGPTSANPTGWPGLS